jgi:hypothetical protein
MDTPGRLPLRVADRSRKEGWRIPASLAGLVASHPRARHGSLMERVVPCRPGRVEMRPRHSTVSVTRAVSCLQSVGVPGWFEA